MMIAERDRLEPGKDRPRVQDLHAALSSPPPPHTPTMISCCVAHGTKIYCRARHTLKKTVNRVLQPTSRDTAGRLSAGTTPVSSSSGVGKFLLPLTSTATGRRNFFLSPSPTKTGPSEVGSRGEAYFASGSDDGDETADVDISDTISAPTSGADGDGADGEEETIDILIAPPAGSMVGNAPHQSRKHRLPSALTKMMGSG